MTKRLELPKFQAFDSNGDPLSGGLVYTYSAGTDTLKTTYSDYDAATPNANPVVLDSRGEADIYVQGSYKIVLKDSAGATIWTLDNVQGGVGADAGGEDFYYPESTAADQGVTGNSDTIKYSVDTISTDEGTIYLTHNLVAATTTYTLTTSESISEGIKLKIENGVRIDGAGTLTFDNPDQIIACQNQQIFGSSITIVFTNPGTIYPQWWGADNNEAIVEDETAIEAAIASVAAGSIIHFSGGSQYYEIADTITISKALTIRGDGESSEIRQVTSNKGIFDITSSGVTVDNIKLYGPQYAVTQGSEKAINAYGVDSSNYITDLKVLNCIIENWGADAIYTQFVSDFMFHNNSITNIYYAGILCLSSSRGTITRNNINTIIGSPNGYGVSLNRTSDDSVATHPRCADITVNDNVITDVTNWEGLDTHGGQRLTFSDNTVNGCKTGIAIVSSDDGSSDTTFAPLECAVVGNTLESGSTAGDAAYGISFIGADVNTQYATGSIIGNIIRGFGDEDEGSNNGCGLWTHNTMGLTIIGNTIIEPASMGIILGDNTLNLSIAGNTIIDPWTDSNANAAAIKLRGSNLTGYIGGNTFGTDAKSAVQVLDYGVIGVSAQTGNALKLGKNSSMAGIYIHSTAIPYCVKGNLTTNTTSGTGEDVLGTQTIPADYFGVGERIRFFAAGTKTGANGNKTIKFYWGATSFTFNAAANDTTDWRLEALVEVDAAGSQKITWTGINGITLLQGYEDAAEDMTAEVIAKITGECANSGDVITQQIFSIESY